MQQVSLEREGRIAIVRFDRGDDVNGLSHALMRELLAVARSFEEDSELSAIVLSGGERVFSLGYDLKDPEARTLQGAGLAERRKALQLGPRLCAAWEALEPLTIAAIEGWCVGGGAALAVSLDLRVMSENATFYVPEVERGMNMSWGSAPRFVRLAGPARSKRVVALAEKVTAPRALEWGLCDAVAPPGAALERALGFARRAAELPPVALRMCKQGIEQAAKALDRAVSFMDGDQFALTQTSEDYREGIRAFLEKRKPEFSGK